MMRIVLCVVYLIAAPFVGCLLDGCDRKITARMQGRQGPSVYQPWWDLQKLLAKERLMVNPSQFYLMASYTVFVVISGALFFCGSDLLLVFFALTTSEIFMVLAASTTSSPYSSMGVNRELIQMTSSEPMVLLTAVGLYLATGTFSVAETAAMGGLPIICKLPGFFIGFVFILTIKMRKSPFDVSTSHHAHQEMVKGVTTEMSGATLACETIANWYEHVMLMGIIGLFCLNGTVWSVLLAIVVALAVYFLEVLIDNTSARVKWQTMFKLAWGVTIVCAGVNLFVLQMLR